MVCTTSLHPSTLRSLRRVAAGVRPASRLHYAKVVPRSWRAWSATASREAARDHCFAMLGGSIGAFGCRIMLDGWRMAGWFVAESSDLGTPEACEALSAWGEAGSELDSLLARMASDPPGNIVLASTFIDLIGTWGAVAAARLWTQGHAIERSGTRLLQALERQGPHIEGLGLPGPGDDPSTRPGRWYVSSIAYCVAGSICIAANARKDRGPV